ncbi:hypothetical protein CAPTEDRAFT_90748 [Capitella teleta]|uniref:phospholipase A2 n=1 Tax=Capitella teleta TaxID=283909 RepID=R7TJI2_CAPTE|nr:hypothetical protein CAPTEDRAFT_90748 [Capitella teleta]|eukprot:ELT91706.1 hypothetical protein CAPTEDRAFT_90748 [Capitella teleta]
MIYPGTNWCGAGHRAEELGEHALADACCKEHDHCPNHIGAFRRKYHLFNWNFYTMSHCDCDDKFFDCLKAAGTSTANIIGRVYFNYLNTDCFVLYLKKSCIDRSFWGKCTKYGHSLHALERDPRHY